MASAHQKGDLANNTTTWEQGGQKGLTLNTKALNVVWGGEGSKGRYWRMTTDGGDGGGDGGSSEVLELLGVCWLEVTGKVPLNLLSPNTTYKFYIKLKLTSAASGWDTSPVILKLRFLESVRSTVVEMTKYLGRGWLDAPEDGLAFTVPQDNNGNLSFAIYEIEGEEWKKGLVIKEVKFVQKLET